MLKHEKIIIGIIAVLLSSIFGLTLAEGSNLEPVGKQIPRYRLYNPNNFHHH